MIEFVKTFPNKVYKINLDSNEISTMNITYHPNYKNAKDIYVYGERIYILDNESNQIYKHNRIEELFGKGDAWVKDNTEVLNANSITI